MNWVAFNLHDKHRNNLQNMCRIDNEMVVRLDRTVAFFVVEIFPLEVSLLGELFCRINQMGIGTEWQPRINPITNFLDDSFSSCNGNGFYLHLHQLV